MAPKTSKADKYTNLIVHSVTCSAANTLTFSEINVGLNLFDKIGLLVERLEFEPSNAAMGEMTTAGDGITLALSSSNALANLLPNQAEIISSIEVIRLDLGVAASGWLTEKSFMRNFSGLSGGGLLIPPKPLYFGINTGGLASAATAYLRIYFTIVQLTDSEYLELLETRRAFG